MANSPPNTRPLRATINWAAASKILGCAPRTLDNWRPQDRSPRFIHVGRLMCYHLKDLEEYLASRMVETDNR